MSDLNSFASAEIALELGSTYDGSGTTQMPDSKPILESEVKDTSSLFKGNSASTFCCHLGCTHNVLDQSAIADSPKPLLEDEIVIAESEEGRSLCEVEG